MCATRKLLALPLVLWAMSSRRRARAVSSFGACAVFRLVGVVALCSTVSDSSTLVCRPLRRRGPSWSLRVFLSSIFRSLYASLLLRFFLYPRARIGRGASSSSLVAESAAMLSVLLVLGELAAFATAWRVGRRLLVCCSAGSVLAVKGLGGRYTGGACRCRKVRLWSMLDGVAAASSCLGAVREETRRDLVADSADVCDPNCASKLSRWPPRRWGVAGKGLGPPRDRRERSVMVVYKVRCSLQAARH